MRNQTPFNVATVADQRFFPGLWAMLISAAAHANDLSEVTFHVVDGGIAMDSWKKLEHALSKHPMPPRLVRHELDSSHLEGLPLRQGKSPLTYARLLFPKMFEFDQLLYLDSDLLVFKDITEIFQSVAPENAGSAALNADGSSLSFDLSDEICERFGKQPDDPYFNAGVMVMNLNYWRKNELAKKCFDFLSSHDPAYVDQTAINVVMNRQMALLDPSWNSLANRIDIDRLANSGFVIHYTSSKPWLLKQLHPTATLFEKFCADTGLQLDNRSPESSPKNQSAIFHFIRSKLYRCLGFANAIIGRTSKAEDYARVAEFWGNFFQDRKSRAIAHQNATEKIMATNFRPEWL
jgi:lipopolysaccharide biosynthesis glycosyltransferase